MSLNSLTRRFLDDFSLTPIMGAEIECYVILPDTSDAGMDSFWLPVDQALRAETLPLLRIEKERGTHQYELVISMTTPETLAHTLTRIRAVVEAQAAAMGVEASFAAKPYAHEPSSGMHLHLHVNDAEGSNAYHKTEDWTSDALRWSLGGLLASLHEQLPIFFPNGEDYARLEDVDHVPKIAGWGVNNRYCALRIPAHPDPYHKWIEHRVPCANADPQAAITAMLEAVLKGLHEQIEPPEQSYGKCVRLEK